MSLSFGPIGAITKHFFFSESATLLCSWWCPVSRLEWLVSRDFGTVNPPPFCPRLDGPHFESYVKHLCFIGKPFSRKHHFNCEMARTAIGGCDYQLEVIGSGLKHMPPGV